MITCQIVTSEADRLAVIDTAWAGAHQVADDALDTAWAANGDRAAVL